MRALKRHRQIYIFPNAFGFLAFSLFVIMILAGATYQNNLVFMMAFLILSLGLVAILQTARNLRDIEAIAISIEPGFPNETVFAHATLKNNTNVAKMSIQVDFELEKVKVPICFSEIEAQGARVEKMACHLPPQRGIYHIKKFKVVTQHPYSLFNSWTYIRLEIECIVYPLPISFVAKNDHHLSVGEEFSGHRTYDSSESPHRIDWKIFSRREILLAKEFKDGEENEALFQWSDLVSLGAEEKLCQLSFWVTQAHGAHIRYRLITPEIDSGVSKGLNHYLKCMKALAKHKA